MIFHSIPSMGNENPVIPKKRYTTTLRIDELKRNDSRRKKALNAKIRQEEAEKSPRYPPSDLDYWLSANCEYNKRVSLNSMASSAIMWEDAWLAYDAFHRRDDRQYWRFDFDQSTWNELSAIPDQYAHRRPIGPPCQRSESTKSCNRGEIRCAHRAQRAARRSDARRPHSSAAVLSSTEKHPFRGYSPSPDHPVLPNGQIYHPQLHQKRPDSVPNYSRPWTPDIVHARRRTSSRKSRAASPMVFQPPITYERVNGVYFDPKPTIAKEIWGGLAIPEVEPRDNVKIDRWLQKHNNIEPEFTSSAVYHPARSPPPIGGKEDSIRTISPQPPSLGKNHTFVSRCSWTTEKSLTKPEKLVGPEMLDMSDDDDHDDVVVDDSAPSPSISTSHASKKSCRSRREGAFSLLTEIIRGLFGSPTRSLCFHDESTCCGNRRISPMRGYQHQPSNFCSLTAHRRADGYGQRVSFQEPIKTKRRTSPPRKRRLYSDEKWYQKPAGLSRRNVIRFITMRSSRIVEEI